MGNDMIALLSAAGIGLLTGLLIPAASLRIIRRKCRKRGEEAPCFFLSRGVRAILAGINALLFGLSAMAAPPAECFLLCMFCFIAMVGAVVDFQIRIIANEMVLLIAGLGVFYRLSAEGPGFLPGALLAVGMVALVFTGAALITYLLKKSAGVGAGDIKLSMAISFAVGYPGALYFLFGLALAVAAYAVLGLMSRLLTLKSWVPMCAPIMAGFLFALFYPHRAVLSAFWEGLR